MRLQGFDYTIKHIQGPRNLAGPFSRLACHSVNCHSYAADANAIICRLIDVTVPKSISCEEIQRALKNDEIAGIIRALKTGATLPAPFLKVKYELKVVDELLLRGDRLVPPKSLR